MALKILHLSDIHFYSFGDNEHLDLDFDLRNELERDLTRLMDSIKAIDVVLIGGDIAFSGKKEEYEKASVWIKSICKITNCKEENVLVVPGNHDIKRNTINPLLKKLQETIKNSQNQGEINKELSIFLSDPNTYNL
jgi:predicted MPP superfamily phosphohydrolase